MAGQGPGEATKAYNGSGGTMKPCSNRVCSLSTTQGPVDIEGNLSWFTAEV